jgi:hypothetical protein
MGFGITESQQKALENQYLNKKIIIKEMMDEPNYTGKEGICTCVDSIGQLHGTWGGLAIQPDKDYFIVVSE